MPFPDELGPAVAVVDYDPDLVDLLESAGFRCRPEPWNRTETSYGQPCEKLVFAPPVGERATNVHVRVTTGPNTRYAHAGHTSCGKLSTGLG